jgi:hypothetical protein
MKSIFLTLFLFVFMKTNGQSSDILYVPKQKSFVVSYNFNYSHVGMYVGGYIKTTFPYPYIYTTPASFINRIGAHYGNGKYNVMVGGYIENFVDSVAIRPDFWVKIYPLRIITKTTEGFDIILALNHMRGLNYAFGISIPFRGIYYK